MSKIIIKRTSELVNGMRDYKIFVDEKIIGTVANGETKEFSVTPGRHKIQAKIDWCSSPTISIDINENKTEVLKVGAFKFSKWFILIGLGLLILHCIITLSLDYRGVGYLFFPLSVVLLYFLTIGRKKYLSLNRLVRTTV